MKFSILPRWLRRSKPTTRLGRILRRLERAIFVVLLLYGGLHAFPQVLFAHSVTAHGLTIYSREPLPPETSERISETMALVTQSELAVPGRHERVFLCNSPGLFRLFCPRSRGAFASSIAVTDHVFVAQADLTRNVATREASTHNTRALAPLIAHEITHGLIRRRLGLIRAFRLSAWVDEGYCEYIAGEGSFPEEEGLRLLAAGQRDSSSPFRYFLFRKMVTHLIDERGLTFAQVVERADEEAAVEAELVRSIQSRGAARE